MDSSQEENVSINFGSTTKEEEFTLSVTTDFYEEEFDDAVFLDYSPSIDLEGSSDILTRSRRTSDVFDCVGEIISPTFIKRHSFPSTSGELEYSTSTTSRATHINEPNRSRHAELISGSFDLGYSSPGAQYSSSQSSSSQSSKGTWFRFSTSNDADSVDAQPNNINLVEEEKKTTIDVTNMPIGQDATCYNMDHEYRGIAVIINNDVFEKYAQNLPARDGSWKDVEGLKMMFYQLDFKVLIWNNLSNEELTLRLQNLAKDDHSNNDCLAVTVLTHGMNSNFIYAKDNLYPVEFLWDLFTADKCPSLAAKPKIFFIQACRGKKYDYGITLSNDIETEVDSNTAAYKIPKHSDFLIVFSTYDGYYSFRHPETGTWFIQSLCLEINKHDLATIDLLRLMTRVCRRVALDYESHNPWYPQLHKLKQIPNINSTLIRDVFFKPKKKAPPEPEVI